MTAQLNTIILHLLFISHSSAHLKADGCSQIETSGDMIKQFSFCYSRFVYVLVIENALYSHSIA